MTFSVNSINLFQQTVVQQEIDHPHPAKLHTGDRTITTDNIEKSSIQTDRYLSMISDLMYNDNEASHTYTLSIRTTSTNYIYLKIDKQVAIVRKNMVCYKQNCKDSYMNPLLNNTPNKRKEWTTMKYMQNFVKQWSISPEPCVPVYHKFSHSSLGHH